MISAIVIPADNDKPVKLIELDEHDVSAYRALVGGSLEIVTFDLPRTTIYLNEEGKNNQLSTNSRATALLWAHNANFRGVDPLAGDVFLVGPADGEGDDLPVSDDLVQLLLHTERYRVQVMRLGFRRWDTLGEEVFDDWFTAYVFAVNNGLKYNDIEEVRVIPARDDEVKALVREWMNLGRKNDWIRTAYDPPFSPESFVECYTVEELANRIMETSWSLGTAFFYRDLCFINQVDGGDEWLTIRHGIAFESITLNPMIERGTFPALITRLLAASKEQCEHLTY